MKLRTMTLMMMKTLREHLPQVEENSRNLLRACAVFVERKATKVMTVGSKKRINIRDPRVITVIRKLPLLPVQKMMTKERKYVAIVIKLDISERIASN